MQKLISIMLAGAVACTAQGQTRSDPQVMEQNWTIACGSYATIADIISPYKERPLVAGQMGSGSMVFFFNKETGTWTFVAMDGRIACVLADGRGGQIVPNPSVGEK